MSVFRIVGRIVMIFALCCAMGLHWMALQSVAWTTMLVQNAKHTSLCKAIVYTLDGAHPCSLCHAVNAGKNSEKKSDLYAATYCLDAARHPFRLSDSLVFVFCQCALAAGSSSALASELISRLNRLCRARAQIAAARH